MELKRIQGNLLQNSGNLAAVGVHEQPCASRERRQPADKGLGPRRRDKARAVREKHEAQGVRAGGDGRLGVLKTGEAANFGSDARHDGGARESIIFPCSPR